MCGEVQYQPRTGLEAGSRAASSGPFKAGKQAEASKSLPPGLGELEDLEAEQDPVAHGIIVMIMR